MGKMYSEISVSIQIWGYPDNPDVLTKKLNLKPSTTWRKGEKRQIGHGYYKESLWELSSGLSKSSELEAHVKSLLKRITKSMNKLTRLGSKYRQVLSCVVYSYNGDRPAIFFDSSVIKKLAKLNTTIDIDLYVV